MGLGVGAPGGAESGEDADPRLRLAELVTTRLCHDLSGPLGTLMGALEMLVDEPEAAEEALSLAGDVSTIMAGRLRLLRAAWSGGAPALDLEEFRRLAEVLATRRLRLDLGGLVPGATFSPAATRVVLNVLLLAADCVNGTGAVRVVGDPSAEVIVTLEGPRAAWPAGFAAVLADPTKAWQTVQDSQGVEASRGLQAPLTALIAAQCRARLSLLMATGTETVPPMLVSLRPDQ